LHPVASHGISVNMAGIKSSSNQLFLREDQLYQGMELLFFAYRDFTSECDNILSNYGFGRAHHRVIYFVARNPNISVTDLLNILRITKQSLSRVLKHLVSENYIDVAKCELDGRRRLLTLTNQGKLLESRLSNIHKELISKAFREAGADSVAGYREVLMGIIDKIDHDRFTNIQKPK